MSPGAPCGAAFAAGCSTRTLGKETERELLLQPTSQIKTVVVGGLKKNTETTTFKKMEEILEIIGALY